MKRLRIAALATGSVVVLSATLGGCAAAQGNAGGPGSGIVVDGILGGGTDAQPSLANSPFSVTDAGIGIAEAQDLALEEFPGNGQISRVVLRTNRVGNLVYAFSVFDETNLGRGIANISVNARSGRASTVGGTRSIEGDEAPNIFNAHGEPIPLAEAEAVALAATGGGEVTRVTMRSNRAGQVLIGFRIVTDSGEQIVTINSATVEVEENAPEDTESDEYVDEIPVGEEYEGPIEG